MMNSFATENFIFLDYTEIDDNMSRMVWECRNRPEIRKWMVNTEYIPYENHLRFVNGLKDENNVRYYAVLQEETLIGSINIHIDNDGAAERGIYIHPDLWGKGLSKKICSELYSYLRKNVGLKSITTKVLKDNLNSNALERSLGAFKTAEDGRFVFYTCDLKHY